MQKRKKGKKAGKNDRAGVWAVVVLGVEMGKGCGWTGRQNQPGIRSYNAAKGTGISTGWKEPYRKFVLLK